MALTSLNGLSGSLYTAFPVGIMAASIFLVIYRVFLHPLAAFPGPLEARLWGVWRDRQYWNGQWHDTILELHRKYGSAVRIAPGELSLVDAKAVRILYNHGSKAFKTEYYETFIHPALDPPFFPLQDKQQHARLKKRVTQAYSMTSITRYEKYMQECLDLFLVKIKKFADAGKAVDMATWTNYLAYDVITTLGYGEPVGMLETESDVMSLQESIDAGMCIMSNMGNYWGQCRWITGHIPTKISSILGIQTPLIGFHQWSRDKLRAKKESQKQGGTEDMLDHFMKMATVDGALVADSEVLTESSTLVGAGADTTSVAMKACLYYLCKNPESYRRAQREVDDYYERNRLQTPITYQQTLDLPFLCAVIKESMRLFPSIPYQLPRYAPEEMYVAEMKIPAGTIVGVSPIAAHRDPEIWGDDAHEFDPARWFGEEERVRRFNAHEMTWGGNGPRTCMGRNIALVEIHKFLAQFLRSFDAAFVDPNKPWRVKAVFFANQYDMHMRISYRGGRAGVGGDGV